MADIAKRLEKADKYLQKGKQKDALSEYLAILEDDPQQDAVRQSAADLCVALGDPGEAFGLLSTLFDHQAHTGNAAVVSAGCFFALAMVCLRLGMNTAERLPCPDGRRNERTACW